jgi:hypothetical protein
MSRPNFVSWKYPTRINQACARAWGYRPAPAIVTEYDGNKRIVVARHLVHATNQG